MSKKLSEKIRQHQHTIRRQQEDGILAVCHERLKPLPHRHTGRLCFKICVCKYEGLFGPYWQITSVADIGLVAYFDEMLKPGDWVMVVERNEKSCEVRRHK